MWGPWCGQFLRFGLGQGVSGEMGLLLSSPHCQLRLLSWDCPHSSCFLAPKTVLLFPPLQFIWTGSCVFEKSLSCHFRKVWGRKAHSAHVFTPLYFDGDSLAPSFQRSDDERGFVLRASYMLRALQGCSQFIFHANHKADRIRIGPSKWSPETIMVPMCVIQDENDKLQSQEDQSSFPFFPITFTLVVFRK